MKIDVTEKYGKFIINYLFYFLFSENNIHDICQYTWVDQKVMRLAS